MTRFEGKNGLKDPAIEGRMISKYFSENETGVLTGLIWYRTGEGGWLL